MANLTKEINLRQSDVRGQSVDSAHETPKVVATAQTFYSGSLIQMNNGRADKLGASAGGSFLGVCDKSLIASGSGNENLSVMTQGPVIENRTIAGNCADVADERRTVYCTTDNIDDATTVRPASNPKPIGRIHKFRSAGRGDILLYTPQEVASGANLQLVPLDASMDVTQASTANFASAPLPGEGRVVALVTVAGAAVTNTGNQAITASVNGLALTGTHTVDNTHTAGSRKETAVSGVNTRYSAGSIISVSNTYTATLAGGPIGLFALVEVYG